MPRRVMRLCTDRPKGLTLRLARLAFCPGWFLLAAPAHSRLGHV
jgi:hypothetical protein